MKIMKILGIIAILVVAVLVGSKSEENDDLTSAKQKLKSAFQDQASKKKENWQNVSISGNNLPPNPDGTIYAYDKNSITPTRDARGEITGAELMAVVIGGDESIMRKHVLFSFFCGGSGMIGMVRINHSYPLRIHPSQPQEEQLANIACAAANCETMRRQNGGASLCN